jgi:hypothetical protein
MAQKFSTGLRDFLLGEGSFRKGFEDCQVKVYSGSAPATADAATTGTLLCTVTKSSGALVAGTRSTEKVHHVTIPDSHASGATVILNVTVDGVGPTSYTYTNTPDLDAAPLMVKVARMLNDIPQLEAIADVTAREIYVMSRIAGLDFTLADGSGTITATVDAAVQAASRSNALSFGTPASGVISKATAETWSGANVATGVAGYFRIVTSSDDATLSTTQLRVQGTVGTSGADMNLNSVNLVSGATTTIDTAAVTFPASA